MQLHGQFHLEPASAEGRRAARRTLRLVVESSGAADSSNVVIHNMSATGLLIETGAALAMGDTFAISLPERGATPVTIVWSSGGFYGCEFDEPISEATISAARLKAPGVERESATDEIGDAAPATPDTSEASGGSLSLRGRLAIIAGASAALWAVIIGAVVVIV